MIEYSNEKFHAKGIHVTAKVVVSWISTFPFYYSKLSNCKSHTVRVTYAISLNGLPFLELNCGTSNEAVQKTHV